MHLRTYTLFLLSALLLMGLASCASVEEMVETGNYDRAISMAQRKLAGKDRKNPKYVQALEVAFERVTQRDLDRAERLKRNGTEADWGTINGIYRTIRKRQERLAPLLPLIDKYGYKANFQFVRTDDLERESSRRAAAFHYEQGLDLLAQARRGDRAAGRKAYKELNRIQNYQYPYRDTEQLLAEAEQLGIVYVLVDIENESRAILPAELERELLRLETTAMNSKWRQFHTRPIAGQTYDYRARLSIMNVEVSPERVIQREYIDEQEIEDGFDYVLDENGNVQKDSLGNDIKVPRNLLIRAFVLETYQEKIALVRGRMELYDLGSEALVDTRDLTAEARFEHRAATFRGDERALSPESRKCIGRRPLPFPNNEALVLDAATQLKPSLQEHLARYSPLI